MQPSFTDEKQACTYLEILLDQWFVLVKEVRVKHIDTENTLRIDYLAKPKLGVDFSFPMFGIEVKASVDGIGNFNKALKQSIDYTYCNIVDRREILSRVAGKRIGYVYMFPSPDDDGHVLDWYGGSERLAGLFHVGLIRVDYRNNPKFCMSSDRQWDPHYGARKGKHCTTDRVASGVKKRTS